MAMIPGGGLPTPPGAPRAGGEPTPGGTAKTAGGGGGGAAPRGRVLHWAVLMGGLVTITDLTLVLAERRSGVTDGSLDTISLVVSALLYSVAGAAVARETGRVMFGALAGLLAGALDGFVLGAAHAATEPFGPQPGVSAQQLWTELVGLNVLLGGSLAWASAWFGSLSRRTSSNRGGRGGGTSRGDDVDKKPKP